MREAKRRSPREEKAVMREPELPKEVLDRVNRFCLDVAREVRYLERCSWLDRGHYHVNRMETVRILGVLHGGEKTEKLAEAALTPEDHTALLCLGSFAKLVGSDPFLDELPGDGVKHPRIPKDVYIQPDDVAPLVEAFEAFRVELLTLVPSGYDQSANLPLSIVKRCAKLLPRLGRVLDRIEHEGRPIQNPPKKGDNWYVPGLFAEADEVNRLLLTPFASGAELITFAEAKNGDLYRVAWAWQHLASEAVAQGALGYYPEGIGVARRAFENLQRGSALLGITVPHGDMDQFVCDINTGQVTREGYPTVTLSNLEFGVLDALISADGSWCSNEELNLVWNPKNERHLIPTSDSRRQAIRGLNAKLRRIGAEVKSSKRPDGTYGYGLVSQTE